MTLRFAILGCGRIGRRHAGHIPARGHLVAVCDVDPARATAVATEFGAKAYSSLHDMLETEDQLDVVSVCTPNGLHAEHSIAALKAGSHVLCEKPLAISGDDCREMIQVAEVANRRLFVVKQNRFNPPVAAVKKALVEGRFGRVLSGHLGCYWNRNADYYADSWRGTLGLDGGTLYTQFSHFVDLMLWMMGDVADAQASITNAIHGDTIEFEDSGVVALKFTNGALGSIHYTVNSFEQNMEGSLTLFCEKGAVKIGGKYLNELEYQHIEDFEITGLPESRGANHYGTYQGSMSNHDQVYDNVVAVLRGEASIAATAVDGLRTVELIERIYRTAGRKS